MRWWSRKKTVRQNRKPNKKHQASDNLYTVDRVAASLDQDNYKSNLTSKNNIPIEISSKIHNQISNSKKIKPQVTVLRAIAMDKLTASI